MRSNRQMRFCGSVGLAASLLFVAATAHAVVPRQSSGRVVADALTALPGAQLGKPLRTHVGVRWGAIKGPAWTAFEARVGRRIAAPARTELTQLMETFPDDASLARLATL